MYTAYFIEMPFFESGKVYSFSFEKEGGTTTYDKRVSLTITKIIRDFFQKNSHSLIFTCDSADSRHKVRNVLFRRWFNSFAGKEYIKHDRAANDLLASIIVESDNPLKTDIIQEFNEYFSALIY